MSFVVVCVLKTRINRKQSKENRGFSFAKNNIDYKKMFKYLFLFVMGLYILQSCFACNGNSTESPANCTETSTAKGRTLKRSPLSTDCGYYPVKEPELPTSIVGSERGQENSTEIPITPKDAWSFIRNSPSYKRTYTCLRSTNVSGNT